MIRPICLVGLISASLSFQVHAASIDVLWTSGTTNYNTDIQTLAGAAGSFDPDGDGALTWNLTLWDGSAVSFGNYDVLVVGSTCNTGSSTNCSGSGFFGTGVTSTGVLSNEADIAAARGNRTFLSGQDADWHYAFDSTPGPFVDDGPKGFLINAVNWAASGTGLGIVSMTDRYLNNAGWWTADNSFLKDELGAAPFWQQAEDVNIGPGQDDFPINEGLSSAGLSFWSTSSHACFDAVSGYTAINIAGDLSNSGESSRTKDGCGVTIVTSAGADGDTSGGDSADLNPVPLPAAGWMLIAGLMGLFGLRQRG